MPVHTTPPVWLRNGAGVVVIEIHTDEAIILRSLPVVKGTASMLPQAVGAAAAARDMTIFQPVYGGETVPDNEYRLFTAFMQDSQSIAKVRRS